MSFDAISLLLVVAILSHVRSTYSEILPHDERSLEGATPVSSSGHLSTTADATIVATTTAAAAVAAAAPAAARPPASFAAAFMETLSMVFISELGDNTFFIAAIMAMKFPRMAVFLGATLALVVMTFVSVLCGSALSMVPTLYTYYCSLLLLWIFGVKMIVDGLRMPENSSSGVLLAAKYGDVAPPKKRRRSEKVAVENVNLIGDDGDPGDYDDDDGGADPEMGRRPNVGVLVTFWQIFVQAFTLTFLGEWGDRSQIATMVLALNVNKYGIMLGSLVGHVVTNGLAVVGGRLVAHKISVKKVSVAGGVVFIVFAFVTFFKNNTGEFA